MGRRARHPDRAGSIRIRRFRLDDLTEIVRFSRRAYGYEAERRHLDDLKLLIEYCTTGYAEEPDGMFVAEKDGRPVGTLFARSRSPEPREGTINWVGVAPALQGRGVGDRLLARAEAYLRSKGVQAIRLGTDRPLAMPFYIGHGFGVVNCQMLKRLAGAPRQRGRLPRLVRTIERYSAFRFTRHNVDQILGEVKAVLGRRSSRKQKVQELRHIARRCLVYPLTPDRAESLKEFDLLLRGKSGRARRSRTPL